MQSVPAGKRIAECTHSELWNKALHSTDRWQLAGGRYCQLCAPVVTRRDRSHPNKSSANIWLICKTPEINTSADAQPANGADASVLRTPAPLIGTLRWRGMTGQFVEP